MSAIMISFDHMPITRSRSKFRRRQRLAADQLAAFQKQ
jgi:hypothetical protein